MIPLTVVKGFGFYVVGLKVLQGRIIRIDQLFRNATSLNNSPPFFLFGASINKSLWCQNYMSREWSESPRNSFLWKPAGQLFTPVEKQDLVWITASARAVNQRKVQINIYIHSSCRHFYPV